MAYYWCSIVNSSEKNTAAWLAKKLTPILKELHEEKVEFAGFIGDNEAVNGALHRKLLVQYPFLVRVPCAAHTIQLVVKDILLCKRWAAVKTQVDNVLKTFSSSKEARNQLISLQEASGRRVVNLIKPNETRWNSFLYASVRLSTLRQFMDIIDEQTELFWADLQLLCEFLTPFQRATDILQRDRSTLFDVFEQWNVLNKHLVGEEDFDVRNVAMSSLRDRWHANVNKAATDATALLSFVQMPEETDNERKGIRSAKEFIASFGSRFLSFFGKSKQTVDELESRLLLQYAAFRARLSPFDTYDRDRRISSSPIQFWTLNLEVELAKVAIALLSIPSSEASVERSFSAQDDIHRKKRNRLKSETVQASMFIAFNHVVLSQSEHTPLPPFKEVELSADYAEADTDDDDSDATDEESSCSEDDDDVEEEEQKEFDQDVVMQDLEMVAAPVRAATELFLHQFIRENGIHSKTRFGPDLTAKLDEAARLRNEGGGAIDTLIKRIRILAKQSAPQE